MRLSTAKDEFLSDCRLRGLSNQTIISYRSDLELLVGLAAVHAADNLVCFTPALVRQYFLALMNKGLSAATLHRRRASVSEFAKWCLLRRLVADHPMAETPQIKRPRRLPRPFGHEARARLDALPLDVEESLVRGLLFHAGLRVSEVCALRVGDVELGDHEGAGSIRVHGKGNKERVVPVNADLWHWLRDYMLARADLRGDQAGRLQAFLLARTGGRPWTRKMVARRTRKWGAALKLDEKVTPHRFRHVFATRLLEEGADLREVQELLGHEDISTTAGYTHVVPERLRSAVNRLAKRAGSEKILGQDSAPMPSEPGEHADK